MTNLTINELKKICEQEIKKGNGNKKVLLSNDDEGNGYHELFYHFTEIDKDFLDISCFPYGVNEENHKDYIILG